MLAKAAVVLAGVLFFATPALAQTNGNTVSGGWTVFGAPGFTLGSVESVGTIHLGGGGQVVWPSGVGLAADVGYLTAAQEFRAGVGIFSPGLIYEFRGAKRYIPYVRAGPLLREVARSPSLRVPCGRGHRDDVAGRACQEAEIPFRPDTTGVPRYN
jgi:hypothetical protein